MPYSREEGRNKDICTSVKTKCSDIYLDPAGYLELCANMKSVLVTRYLRQCQEFKEPKSTKVHGIQTFGHKKFNLKTRRVVRIIKMQQRLDSLPNQYDKIQHFEQNPFVGSNPHKFPINKKLFLKTLNLTELLR